MTSLGLASAAIDQCYEEFVISLPDELHSAARHLPLRLGLSDRAGARWSEVLEDSTTWALPTSLLAQLARPVSPQLRASAQRAHLFAMLSALIHERIEVGEAEAEAEVELDGVLSAIERQRHRALAELRLLGADRNSSFAAAEREARSACAAERAVFEGRREAGVPDYVVICSGKQSLGFPAVMAALVAAGAELDELGHTHDLILGVMLGIEVRREVVERRDRAQAKISWVEALAVSRPEAEVVGELLELAAECFDRAAAAAEALAAADLHRWAQAEARQVRGLIRLELEAGRARLRNRNRAA